MIAFLVQRPGLIFPRQWPRRTAVYRGSAGRARIKVRPGVLPANEPIWELTKVCRRRTPLNRSLRPPDRFQNTPRHRFNS
jgi:hypothetical protein